MHVIQHYGFYAVAFVVALGALVAFHEFGHFWVARRSGVKVLKFSIGFGPKLAGRQKVVLALFALTFLCFGICYWAFMRQEIRTV